MSKKSVACGPPTHILFVECHHEKEREQNSSSNRVSKIKASKDHLTENMMLRANNNCVGLNSLLLVQQTPFYANTQRIHSTENCYSK